VSKVASADEYEPFDGSENGPLDRFWKYHSIHSVQKSLINPQTGLDQYQNILSCLQEKIGHLDYLISNDQRRIGLMLREPEEDKDVYAVIVKNAFLDSHVLAVQELARCVRTHLPHLYESRAMYQEMNLDQDDGHGGNCPTHLGSLVPLFLPQVRSAMQNVLVDAYEAAGWREKRETCSYRATKDFRLSFAIYMADITEDSYELVASDTTLLWPTEGDTQWIWALQGWEQESKN
jgi:hypothetical protein